MPLPIIPIVIIAAGGGLGIGGYIWFNRRRRKMEEDWEETISEFVCVVVKVMVYPEHVVIEVLKWSVEQFLKFNLSGLGVTNCDVHKGGALVKPAFLDRALRNLIAERILFF